MATKVLSIEIGQGLTRVVEMDYKTKNPKIYQCFTFSTPKGIVKDGMIHFNDTFISMLKSECGKHKAHTTKVVFSITSSRIANREVKLPLIKEKQIQDVLNANATDFFPVDMSQYHLAYRIIHKVNNSEEKSLYLNVLAVPNELTECYVRFAQACGFTIMALDYVGNSICQAMEDSFTSQTHAIIKAEERNTLITVVKDKKIAFQRTVNYGINDAIDTVRANAVFGTNLSYVDAMDILCRKTCIRRYLNADASYREEEDTDMKVMEGRIAVTQSLSMLIASINRILEYYMETSGTSKIDQVSLVGLSGDFSGLSKLMSNELQQKVRVFHGAPESVLAKKVRDDKFGLSTYIACVGAALNPLNLMPEQAKGAKGKAKGESAEANSKNIVVIGAGIFAVGLIAAIALAATTMLGYVGTKNQIAKTQANIEALQESGVEAIYNEYMTVTELSQKLAVVYDGTRSRSEDLVAFIGELENKMPSSTIVMNFYATSQGVSMSMTVDSKEAAAKTLMQLKTFESIQVVSSTGLTESIDENGETTVAFSVDCTYKPVGAEETEAE